MAAQRPLEELINLEEPAWDDIQKWIAEGTNPVKVLPKDPERAKSELFRTQVTTRSPMGAIIYETGGLIIDNGWIRVLGSGCKEMNRGFSQWNLGKSISEYGQPANFCLIADDILGGFFAINMGKFEEDFGNVYYFDPSGLKWQSLGSSYSNFLVYLFQGDLNDFYKDLRWPGYETEAPQVGYDQGLSIFPPLWSAEGKDPAIKPHRAIVPIEELYSSTVAS